MTDTAIRAFNCRMCGHCCHGEGGIVMNRKDRERMAVHLGLSLEAFCRAHTVSRDGKVFLATREDGYCVFFDEGCGVHPARPNICRAWPFFRGNIIDETSWEMIQEYCPGVNGKAGFALFVSQGLDYIEAHGLAEEDGGDGAEALKIDVKRMRD